ncbi:FKBP-type peptidyl-prolyl cis-trans isomerase [Methanoculleus taiwanensis]|uniref:FKBP-type peptidyl-prolyl cis-trans isomerase n=1 Tax=Methanoculleus taiwanensis TaxID=1550565 RepID=UPI001F4F60F5|nr:FKBP-type peptidyl-prolyl cis-trans isomerase [Methanoculleus taiwanensis]
MAPVTDGDTLLLHFTSTRPDGEIFEDTRSGEPVRVTLGAKQINPLFEEALIGREPGETVAVVLPRRRPTGSSGGNSWSR